MSCSGDMHAEACAVELSSADICLRCRCEIHLAKQAGSQAGVSELQLRHVLIGRPYRSPYQPACR